MIDIKYSPTGETEIIRVETNVILDPGTFTKINRVYSTLGNLDTESIVQLDFNNGSVEMNFTETGVCDIIVKSKSLDNNVSFRLGKGDDNSLLYLRVIATLLDIDKVIDKLEEKLDRVQSQVSEISDVITSRLTFNKLVCTIGGFKIETTLASTLTRDGLDLNIENYIESGWKMQSDPNLFRTLSTSRVYKDIIPRQAYEYLVEEGSTMIECRMHLKRMLSTIFTKES